MGLSGSWCSQGYWPSHVAKEQGQSMTRGFPLGTTVREVRFGGPSMYALKVKLQVPLPIPVLGYEDESKIIGFLLQMKTAPL